MAADIQTTERNHPLRPVPDELCSRELRRFLKTHDRIWGFFFFNLSLTTAADEQRLIAARALAHGGEEKDVKRLEQAEKEPRPTLNKLREFANLQQDNICIRSVNNFTSYLSEITQTALKKRPEILRSSEQVKLEDILRFTNYKDLVAFLVNRKINELSYKSLSDFEQFLVDRTGLYLSDSGKLKTNIMFGIEIRNIFTHSRGIVTETTLRRLDHLEQGREIKVGERFDANYDELVTLSNSLVAVARDLDSRFCSKFLIRRKRYGTYDEVAPPQT